MTNLTEKAAQKFQSMFACMIVKDAKAAIELYKKAFGAVQESILVEPNSGKVMHSCISIGNTKFFIFDEMQQRKAFAPGQNGSNCNFYLYVDNADAGFKQAMAAGMKEIMPPTDMFWGDRDGVVEDPFGYKWNIAQRVKELSPEEIQKAFKDACGKAA